MRTLTALVLLALLAGPVAGRVDEAARVVVPDRGASVVSVAERDLRQPVRSSASHQPAVVVPAVRPSVRLPANPPTVIGDQRPLAPSVQRAAGTASWYCGHGSRCTAGYPGGLYAAIRRDLLDLLDRKGSRARVCRSDTPTRCVVVTIVDCNCGLNANLIDLYSAAFSRLAPLSRGRISVTLEWNP